MPTELSKDLLRRLSLAPGAPGAEGAVRDIVRECLAGVGTITYDRLGSILCELRGQGDAPRVVLDAHLDEVGFLVQSISEEGRIGLVPLGGWWGHVLLGQRVDVVLDDRFVPGVVGSKPPHFLQPSERNQVLSLDQMYVDVGASNREQVEEIGVRVGDPVVPHAEWVELSVDGVVSSKALDNRCGVGLLCEVMRTLAGREPPGTVIGVGAVQEEVGCRGAETASALAGPDVAIVLEGTPADDLPGFKEQQGALGKGPQIRFFDPTAISNRRLVRIVEEVAADKGISVQLAVRRSGGTDARSIQRHGAGVPTVVVGVPARYIHTHASIISWEDYARAHELVVAVVERLDADTVAALVDFAGQ